MPKLNVVRVTREVSISDSTASTPGAVDTADEEPENTCPDEYYTEKSGTIAPLLMLG